MKKLFLTFALLIIFPFSAHAAIHINYYRAVDEIHAESNNVLEFPERGFKLNISLLRTKMEFKKPYDIRDTKNNFNLLILKLEDLPTSYKFKEIYLLETNGTQEKLHIDTIYFDKYEEGFITKAELILLIQPDNDEDTLWFKNALLTKKLSLQLVFTEQPPLTVIIPEKFITEWELLFSEKYDQIQMQKYIEAKYPS